MAKVTDTVAELARPYVEQAGCTLWDVEYIKEAGEWFLRVYLDKEGGVSIDDFEVSSAGLDRPLRRPEHFAQCMGQQVDVRLYRPVDGRKEYTGVLSGYEDGDVTVDGRRFPKGEVALVRLHVTF